MAQGFTIRDPFTGKTLAAYAYEPWEAVLGKAERAREAGRAWAAEPVETRVRLLGTALGYFRVHAGEIAREITRQMGKPIRQAEGEIRGLLERAEWLLGAAPQVLAPEALPEKPGFRRRIEHVPLGTVLIISAWNYPLLVSINGVLTALLAGNAVLLKHSPLTPTVGRRFAEAFERMGPHADVLQDLIVDHPTADRLVAEGPVDHVLFTGSVRGGREVHRAAADRFLEVGLELGGKDPAYVAEDADLARAAETVVDGAMYNAGQSCCAVERAYAHARVYDEFVERCARIARGYVLGDPSDPATTLGPLARGEAAAREVREQLADAFAKGARAETGGKVLRIGEGDFCEPAVLTRVDHSMAVMREESFAPILPIMRVTGDEEALRLANDSRYGLTAAIFTRDPERAERFARGAEAGTVFMNRCDYLDPALPWTGVKDSGRGSMLSRHGFLAVTRRKALHFRLETGG